MDEFLNNDSDDARSFFQGILEILAGILAMPIILPIKAIALFGIPIYWIFVVQGERVEDNFLFTLLLVCSIFSGLTVILLFWYYCSAILKRLVTESVATANGQTFLSKVILPIYSISVLAAVAAGVRAYSLYW